MKHKPEAPAIETLFDLSTVAKILWVSPSTLRKIVKRGEIEFTRVGNGIRFSKPQVDAYLETAKERFGVTA